MCRVFTSQIAYQGPDRLDTTVKSSVGLGKLLAPTWALVGGIKCHETKGRDPRWSNYPPLTPEQYSAGYYARLRARYRADPAPFITLLKRERCVICCYCSAQAFCHRHLAVDILDKIAHAKGLPFVRSGELFMPEI